MEQFKKRGWNWKVRSLKSDFWGRKNNKTTKESVVFWKPNSACERRKEVAETVSVHGLDKCCFCELVLGKPVGTTQERLIYRDTEVRGV